MNPVDHVMVVVQRWLCPQSRTGKLSLNVLQKLLNVMIYFSTARKTRLRKKGIEMRK